MGLRQLGLEVTRSLREWRYRKVSPTFDNYIRCIFQILKLHRERSDSLIVLNIKGKKWNLRTVSEGDSLVNTPALGWDICKFTPQRWETNQTQTNLTTIHSSVSKQPSFYCLLGNGVNPFWRKIISYRVSYIF